MFRTSKTALGPFVFFALFFAIGVYFTFAAVQGDYGLFRRAEIEADAKTLQRQLSEVRSEVARMENLARRLSDDYLDLDLLDEQTRSVLGMIRADEVVVR